MTLSVGVALQHRKLGGTAVEHNRPSMVKESHLLPCSDFFNSLEIILNHHLYEQRT